MRSKYSDLQILLALLWAGMIAGISFLEAPVKFTAPSLTLQVGLDVGRHVFSAFNKVEIVFGTLTAILIIKSRFSWKVNMLLVGTILLLLLECFWLLPVLDERVVQIIAGKVPQGSSSHTWYIMFDGLKLIFLIAGGYLGLRENKIMAAA